LGVLLRRSVEVLLSRLLDCLDYLGSRISASLGACANGVSIFQCITGQSRHYIAAPKLTNAYSCFIGSNRGSIRIHPQALPDGPSVYRTDAGTRGTTSSRSHTRPRRPLE